MSSENLVRFIKFFDLGQCHIDGFSNRPRSFSGTGMRLSGAFFDVDYLPPDTECLCARLTEHSLDVAIQFYKIRTGRPLGYGLLVESNCMDLAGTKYEYSKTHLPFAGPH